MIKVLERVLKIFCENCRPCIFSVIAFVVWLPGFGIPSARAEVSVDSIPEIKGRYYLSRVDYWAGVSDFLIADLDGDGVKDLFRVDEERRIYQANKFVRERVIGPALYQGNSLHFISAIDALDIDSTPGAEIFLVKRDVSGDSLWVEVYKGAEKTLLCQTEAIQGKDLSKMIDSWDGGVSHCYAADLDDDGSVEIILPLTVAFDLYPRGIYVYGYPSGKLKWWFPLAGNPLDLSIEDANRDGFKEIYVKTFACCNGAVVGDRADTLAYIHVLDHLGNVIWSQRLGDGFDLLTGCPLICDCDRDGVIEIYYTMILHNEEFDQNVWILQKRRAADNFFLEQRSFEAGREFLAIKSGDLFGDGRQYLILERNMCIVDPVDLSIITCGEARRERLLLVEDMNDEDKLPEIITSRQDSLYILGPDMKARGILKRGGDSYFTKVEYVETPFGDDYLLATVIVQGERVSSVLDFYEVEYASQIPKEGAEFPVWVLLLGWAVGIMLGAMGCYVLIRNRHPKPRPRRIHAAQYNNLLTSLVNFNHGRMAGKNLNRLMFLFSNLPETADKLDEIKPNLQAAIDAYQSFTSKQLEEIVNNARQLKPIRADVQDLSSHSQKLSEQMGDINILEINSEQAVSLKRSMPPALGSLKANINAIRKYLQAHFSANLLRVIPDVLSALAGQFQQKGIGFSEISTKGGVAALIFFDESELAAIFEELLSNAADAMEESDFKELTLNIVFEGGEVNIKLTDSGRGLQTKDYDQVFNRDYSTAGSDRGFGLYHARNQVERFGGRIRLYNNTGRPGATVELILKLVNNE